jgi:hypothetical protein
MGTRAAFWIGDPRRLDAREWLGCKAWDGHPRNPEFAPLLGATTEAEFRAAAEALRDTRPDGGWPYPWADDVFLTDFTYAFLDGETRVSSFHHGFHPASEVTAEGFVWPDEPDDPTTRRIPAPSGYDPSQPDSILIMRL